MTAATDEKIERELLARLDWLLDTGPPAELQAARRALVQFYHRGGLHNGETYFRFDDETKELVPFNPAPGMRVNQSGWSYRG